MKNINDLRAALFETMADVRSGKLEVSQAKAITDLGQAIINTAKVEVDFIRYTNSAADSGFITAAEKLPKGVVGITRHRIAG